MDEQKKQEYAEYVKEVTPKNNLFLQMAKAFLVGGVICVIGQVILNTAQQKYGLDKDTAGSWCAMLLVLASAILTGFNLYQKLVKFGGAGALVPITGLRGWVQDLYDRWTGDFVRDLYELGVGGDLLDREDDGDYLTGG